MSCRKGRVIYPLLLKFDPVSLLLFVLWLERINEKEQLGPITDTPSAVEIYGWGSLIIRELDDFSIFDEN